MQKIKMKNYKLKLINSYKLIWIGSFFIIISAIAFLAYINIYITEISQPYIYRDINSVPSSEFVLILGASVYSSGRLSEILSDRAKTAIEMHEAGKIGKILISGYKKDEHYDEVASVKNFLLDNGIGEENILVDEEGHDTYDSLYRAKNIFNIDELIISTQDFHLPRAIYIGRSIGIDAYGITADKQAYQRINYFILREKFANLKAFFEVKFNKL